MARVEVHVDAIVIDNKLCNVAEMSGKVFLL